MIFPVQSASLNSRSRWAFTARRWKIGFTLVELLVVIAIIAILSAIAAPLIPSLLRGNQLDASVATLTGILEQAREAAISGNTYVWVAFTDAPTNSPNGTWVAMIQSIDGTESPVNTAVIPVWLTSLTAPSTTTAGNLILIGKIQNLAGVRYLDGSNLSTAYNTLVGEAPTSFVTPFDTATWTVTPLQYTSAVGSTFNHVIEFTPDGEAHTQTWASNIQFGLTPSLGTATNGAVINVNRLTGKATVFRQ